MVDDKRLTYLKSHENFDEKSIEIDESRPKYFVTFPYPYMNGKLHLGHLFTLSKAEFYARYMKLKGYNVLFPLGFHCTGMPISASAKKLAEELEISDSKELLKSPSTVYSILKSFGFEDEIVSKFVDPQMWLDVFPKLCQTTLTNFHSMIDFSKSFITTERNPYYDSFVRWQFAKIKEKGLAVFGKRYTIFDPVTDQPCLDHDRQTGEGVLPVAIDLFVLKKIVDHDIPLNICLNKAKNQNFSVFKYNGELFAVPSNSFKNIKYQCERLEFIDEIDISSESIVSNQLLHSNKIKDIVINAIKTTKIPKISEEESNILDKVEPDNFKLNLSANFLRYYEPQSQVIARSKGICVVALTDQWFLNYNDEELKKKGRECIENMVDLSDDVKLNLIQALDWIEKWAFSRSFGLGTKIPFDEQYIIDSLSDSTIYMIFYTFNDLLFKDIYGNDQILPHSNLSNDFWDAVIYGKEIKTDKYISDVITKARKRFEHFYPVDLRVSGKDLTRNHLIFFILNHCALFPQKYWPRKIYTNGHLMLNSQKMSKSTGNFMSADDCINKFGVSATRMCLATCGDGNEDANFVEDFASSFVDKLYILFMVFNKIKSHQEGEDLSDVSGNFSEDFSKMKINEEDITIGRTNNINYGDLTLQKEKNVFTKPDNIDYIENYFFEAIVQNFNLTIESYEKMKFMDVIKYGFYEMTNIREMYLSLGGKENTEISTIWASAVVNLMYPIVPSLINGITSNYPFISKIPLNVVQSEFNVLKDFEWLKKLTRQIKFSVKKFKKVPQKITLGLNENYSEIKQKLMACDGSISKINDLLFGMNKKIRNEYTLFAMDYAKNKINYERVNERKVLEYSVKYIEKLFNCTVSIVDSPDGEPLAPKIIIE
ncbi:hypothetical protein EDEG_00674 [Edhazardia aedis USNM 41457]|uniref:leucine--tRNA ligase n=1 Tax=Edhazardia aedis (strain USNM 41457) TaxID=1003232 RepID=J9DCL8_EDHAE|nr:hypothetical protein EDEG_00674 [Edhazardia aedis USNM 41457]|eukprot:EJW05209.1 hypothetical protein EDEG_00674 [Edhazardia aedis USNM 41457]